MVIIHSDRTGFTNFDNVQRVSLMGRYINVALNDGSKETIAAYQNADRTAEVFADMLMKLFPEDDPMDSDKIIPFISADPDMFIEDINVFNLSPQWYYMPEE